MAGVTKIKTGMASSTQLDFEGQQGWNDCAPEVFAGVARVRGTRKPRRVVSEPIGHTSLRCTLPSAPPTVEMAGPRPQKIDTPKVDSSKTDTSKIDAAHPIEGKEALDKILALLERSRLTAGEKSQFTSRLTSAIPNLEQTHLVVLERSLELSSSEGRHVLVQHTLMNHGVAGWVTPVRRILENL